MTCFTKLHLFTPHLHLSEVVYGGLFLMVLTSVFPNKTYNWLNHKKLPLGWDEVDNGKQKTQLPGEGLEGSIVDRHLLDIQQPMFNPQHQIWSPEPLEELFLSKEPEESSEHNQARSKGLNSSRNKINKFLDCNIQYNNFSL